MSTFGLVLLVAALATAKTAADHACITLAVYGEARGESEIGQALVAQTILNRVSDPRWPDAACEVVAAYEQFDGFKVPRKIDARAFRLASQVTAAVSEGRFQTGSCSRATHFHAAHSTPGWARSPRMKRLCRVDNHVFYFEEPHR